MQNKRKIVWVLSCAILLNVALKAQSITKDSLVKSFKITIPYQWTSVFSLGFKLNYNKAFQNNFALNNFSAAPVFEWQFLRHLSIGIEPTYVQSVSKDIDHCPSYICEPILVNPLTPYIKNEDKVNINYFSLPILLKFRFPILKNRLSITSEIGWSKSWLLSFKHNSSFDSQFLDMQGDDKLNTFDNGLNFGSGISIPLKKGFFDINMRYYFGKENVIEAFESKNQVLTYQLGYRFIL